MTAIFKREINAYFDTPLGYVFLAVYYLFAGYFFYNYNLYANSTDMRALFEILFTVTLFLVPILTMRLMSEDRRNKTDQLLMMAPIGTLAIVMGKLLAAAVVYLAAMLITIVEAFVLSVFAAVEWSVVFGHFIGLFLLGLALISVGMLISTLTENQIIAAIGTFIISVLLMYMDSLASVVSNEVLSTAIQWFSFNDRYSTFTQGMFSISSVIFFISVVAVFVFLTARKVESRRWS